jgi:alkanesulfonate monooxygenase SsuD/methylene tetrahydromethanopterin reductase-like flavin-dependent oxidoreductase (luciferase family)
MFSPHSTAAQLLISTVTTNLAFGITASTTFEPPFLLAKRFSTLDHLTGGRIGWYVNFI